MLSPASSLFQLWPCWNPAQVPLTLQAQLIHFSRIRMFSWLCLSVEVLQECGDKHGMCLSLPVLLLLSNHRHLLPLSSHYKPGLWSWWITQISAWVLLFDPWDSATLVPTAVQGWPSGIFHSTQDCLPLGHCQMSVCLTWGGNPHGSFLATCAPLPRSPSSVFLSVFPPTSATPFLDATLKTLGSVSNSDLLTLCMIFVSGLLKVPKWLPRAAKSTLHILSSLNI